MNPSKPNIRKTTPSTLQTALAINPPLICGLSIREQPHCFGPKEMAACSLSALPMTATAQAAFSTHDGKELTPPQFLRMQFTAFTPYLSLTRIASDRSPVINAITVPPNQNPDLA